MHRYLSVIVGCSIAGSACAQQLTFTDATAGVGLGGITAGRLCLADVNCDGRPDAVIRATEAGKPDRYRVFLNTVDAPKDGTAAGALKFVEMERASGLPVPQAGDCLVFADIDNDGHADAVFTRYLDINNEKYVEPPEPKRTCMMKGNGDGTFGAPVIIDTAQRATTTCIAVGDSNNDGLLDLYLGNWYTKYGTTNEAFTNDLLYQVWEHWNEYATPADERRAKSLRGPKRERQPADAIAWLRRPLSEDAAMFDEQGDAAGRPTYGTLFTPMGILELNYGRRANRLWAIDRSHYEIVQQLPGVPMREELWSAMHDIAPALGIDGDADRSGKYPDWLKERAKLDPRFEREDEKPYRSNGNHFDASVNDIDNDGDFDVFLAMITHAWAGPSSDRSRFLVNQQTSPVAQGGDTPSAQSSGGGAMFAYDPRLSVDRAPSDPTVRNWNQGDLFCQLEDFDNDGRVDLLLSSGDYPDNQRLRLFRQQDDGSFKDITSYCGLNNEGSAQISVGDVDQDGDLDILVAQSFNRLDAAQIAGRTPTVKLYLNQMVEKRGERIKNKLEVRGAVANSLTLKLVGDPAKACSRDALGAIVRVTADVDGDPATPPVTQSRQLIGIGGHAGKQMEFLVHVGLGAAAKAESVEVVWPDRDGTVTVLSGLEAGKREVRQGQ